MKILFQGDSITDAFRQPQESNPAFQLGNGYVFLIAAHLAGFHPAGAWEFVNRGVSGNGVRHLRERWQQDAISLKPDVLSLLIGVNETISAIRRGTDLPLPEFRGIYHSLLADLRTANPAIRLVLIEPFVLEAGAVTPEWRDHLGLRQDAVRELAEEFGAIFIPLQSHFDQATSQAPPEFWAWDGIHPTHAGFQLIAESWLREAGGLLH